MPVRYTFMESPVGPLRIAISARALVGVHFAREGEDPGEDWTHDPEMQHPAIEQLDAYFRGQLRRFDLELEPVGTDFQQKVWRRLAEIPYGETTSYGAMARELGTPGASRAVGAANGQNPLAIVLPCHRVVGSTGKLTGFAGGIEIKRWLLDFERRHAGGQLSFELA